MWVCGEEINSVKCRTVVHVTFLPVRELFGKSPVIVFGISYGGVDKSSIWILEINSEVQSYCFLRIPFENYCFDKYLCLLLLLFSLNLTDVFNI